MENSTRTSLLPKIRLNVIPEQYAELRATAELFLNVEQIIPTPEASDFMIGMMAKEAEEKSASNEQRLSHRLRLEFWDQTLEAFSQSSCDLYNNISPGKDHWLAAGSGLSGMTFNLIFGKSEVRVEFSMARTQAEANKFVFNRLEAQKQEIERIFGALLSGYVYPIVKHAAFSTANPLTAMIKTTGQILLHGLWSICLV